MDKERYVDIPDNEFDEFVRESLLYNYDIILKEYAATQQSDDGVHFLIGMDNIELQYTDDDSDDVHPVTVWFRSQAYDNNEWCYLDNISKEFYERRHHVC